MTREEYNKKYDELSAQAREIARQKVELEKEFLSGLPFKIGDKVKLYCGVKNKELMGMGWITELHTTTFNFIDIRYNPPKKNGERSTTLRREILPIDNIIVINDEELN